MRHMTLILSSFLIPRAFHFNRSPTKIFDFLWSLIYLRLLEFLILFNNFFLTERIEKNNFQFLRGKLEHFLGSVVWQTDQWIKYDRGTFEYITKESWIAK